jgi:hypothetical protein
MPILSYKMGPGTFTLGVAPLDVSCQVTALTINPTENVDTEDAVHVLCGDVLPATDTVDYTYTVAGSLLQDLATGGVVDYTWTNAGDEVPFVFVPNTAEGRQVTGTCRLIPLTIGGDVPTRPSSDFEWAIIGTPLLGDTALT